MTAEPQDFCKFHQTLEDCNASQALCPGKIEQVWQNALKSAKYPFREPPIIISEQQYKDIDAVATEVGIPMQDVYKILDGYAWLGEKMNDYPEAWEVYEAYKRVRNAQNSHTDNTQAD